MIKYFKIFLINIIILYFFLYLLEIFINYKDNKLFQKTRLYYLNKASNNKENKVYLNFGSYKLLDEKQNSILPLSGYENSKILLCLDEKNKPIYFMSDENGFNNKNYIKHNDFLLIGDSYVQGICVNNNSNLNAELSKKNFKSTSLGVIGNGPLLEYAAFKEYESDYEYQNLVLFITPDNDFYDLSKEIENKFLIKYLEKSNFKQNLKSKKNKEEKITILDNFFGNKTVRFADDILSVYHFNLKQVGKLIEKIFKKKRQDNITYSYLYNNKIDDVLLKIINKIFEVTKEKNISFYIVFNSTTPDILFSSEKKNIEYQSILFKKISNIKNYLKSKDIKYFDFNEYLKENYNSQNINEIFKKIDNRWDHYTEKGYNILSKKIINLINHE